MPTMMDTIVSCVIIGIPLALLLIVTRQYIPFGWIFFLTDVLVLTSYLSWKPYHWHMNNEVSVRLLKEHGITNHSWWGTRKLFLDRNQFLVNEQSIVKFYNRDVVVVYWPSIREILWYELENDKKMVEYINIIVSDENFIAIENHQMNFDHTVEILKHKIPEFADNWDDRRELPEDEEIGTILYQKYPD